VEVREQQKLDSQSRITAGKGAGREGNGGGGDYWIKYTGVHCCESLLPKKKKYLE
jgi:hypothetical protein